MYFIHSSNYCACFTQYPDMADKGPSGVPGAQNERHHTAPLMITASRVADRATYRRPSKLPVVMAEVFNVLNHSSRA